MINFYKYEGAGNDFVMINNMDKTIDLSPLQIQKLCDRHFGIGADGVILLEPSDNADCFMNYYNSDGTKAEMCGNGSRCTAKFFLEQMKSDLKEVRIDTRAGVKNIIVNEDDTYSVNMGAPLFIHSDFPEGEIKLEGFDFNCVSMGNPHAVTIVDSLENIDLSITGPKVESDSHFPKKINVEFVEKINDGYYKVAVWERGCGITLACGTGACAVFAVLNKIEKFDKEITLEFPGGKLYLSQNSDELNQSEGLVAQTSQREVLGEIILRGPATFVFKGEIILQDKPLN